MVHAHNMNQHMKNRYRVFRRGWGTYYCEDLVTKQQTTLKTRDKDEAFRLVAARNETEDAPAFSLHLARVYLPARKPAASPSCGLKAKWRRFCGICRGPAPCFRICGASARATARRSFTSVALVWASKASRCTATATHGPSAQRPPAMHRFTRSRGWRTRRSS